MVMISSRIFFLVALLFYSCNKGDIYRNEGYNIVIQYNPLLSFDFNSDTISMDMNNFKNKMKLNLSQREKESIINIFNENEIFKHQGIRSLGRLESLLDVVEIKIYKESKIYAELFISVKNETEIVSTAEDDKGLADFVQVFLKTVNNNMIFKEMSREFGKQQMIQNEFFR